MDKIHNQVGPHLDELAKLDGAVDDFACEMKTKLHRKALEGARGWDDPTFYTKLRIDLNAHADRLIRDEDPQEIDIANLAMMLWFQRERRSSDSATGETDGG